MNKLLPKVAKLFLGLSLAAGVGVAVGTNKKASSVSAAAGDSYNLVKDVSNLSAGDEILLGYTNGSIHKASGALNANTGSYLKAEDATISNEVLTYTGTSVKPLTLAKSGDNWTFTYDSTTVATTAAKKMCISTTSSSVATWTISITAAGVATITSTTSSYGTIYYNTGSPRFLNYTSSQATIGIYKKAADAKTVTGIEKKNAPTKTQYVSGESFDPSGLVVTISYDSGDPEDVSYVGHEADFDWSPKTITTSGNVEIQYLSYSTMKVTQAVTLVTVLNVVSVASHPSEIMVGKSINPDDVILNVTYSNSTSGTVKATSVSCDTSISASGVTATATYSEATGTKTATFTIDVVVVPGFELIDSTGSLRNNARFVLYSSDTGKIMGSQYSTQYRYGITFSEVEDGFIATSAITTAEAEILTLVSAGSNWNLKTSDNKYLACTTDSSNYVESADSIDTSENKTTDWAISFSGNNVQIQSVYLPNRYLQARSDGDNRFSCYKGTQKYPQIYLEVDTTPYFSISDSQLYLGPRGTQTLTLTPHNGASDTVSWSTSNASIVSIPNNSTGLSVVVTGVTAGGPVTITATFGHPETYESLTCSVEVLDLQPYVNVKVSSFDKISTKPSAGWDGTYIIGDATSKTILDGSLSPLPGAGTNFATLENLGDSLNATSDLISKSFTIKSTETSGIYTIRSNSYYFIGNSTPENGMNTSVKTEYTVAISDSGEITNNSTTLAYNGTSGSETYRFYKNLSASIRAVGLWKANGEIKEISSTLASWYDNAKSNNYLVCNASGSGSSINWTSLEESATEMLSVDDLDVLENMTAKPSESGGNYLEDFISDYDYLVARKGYADFLGREAAGTLSVIKLANTAITLNSSNNSSMTIIIIVALTSISSIGVLLVIKRKRSLVK